MTVSENISTGLESFSPIRIIQTSSSLRDLREFTLEGLHSFHFYEPWGESIIYMNIIPKRIPIQCGICSHLIEIRSQCLTMVPEGHVGIIWQSLDQCRVTDSEDPLMEEP